MPDDLLKAFVIELVSHMRAGEYLYVQCADGNGRSGTVAALLMGLAYGISSSEALDLCQRSRNDRPGAGGLAPETHEQKMQVHRLLGDAAFRGAVAGVAPRPADSLASDESALLAATLAKLRAVLARRGPCSLIYLRRFAAANIIGSVAATEISRSHFQALCSDAEWYLTPEEAAALWAAVSGSHTADRAPLDALWRTVRGRLSDRRAAAVHDVFKRLSGGTGFVSMHRLSAAFSPTAHPDVSSGRKAVEEVTAEFNDTFGVGDKSARGERQVSAGEFESYYASISPAIADDALFELWVYGSWLPAGNSLSIPGMHTASHPSSVDDGRTGVSRIAALRQTQKRGITDKVTSLPSALGEGPVAGSADGVTAYALTQAYLAETREAEAESVGAVGWGTGRAGSASSRGASAIPLACTEHGYAYVDLQDMGRIRTAVRSLLRRSAPGGVFALAAIGGALRRQDHSRSGLITAVDLQTAFAECGVSLPDADINLVFRTIASHLLGAPASEFDASSQRLPLEDVHAALRERELFPGRAFRRCGGRQSVEWAAPHVIFHVFIVPLVVLGHTCISAALEGPRLDVVLSIFQGLDRRGMGAVPVGTLLAAFNAEAFPPVATGRMPAHVVYRAFQDGFAEAFTLVDKYGPEARRQSLASREGPTSPAYRAYFGHGAWPREARRTLASRTDAASLWRHAMCMRAAFNPPA